MKYNKLGNTDLEISALGFGTMRLPVDSVKTDFSKAISLLQYGIEKGINFFDVGTFYCQGFCEEIFGLATKNIPGEELIIAGKNSTHQTYSYNWEGQLINSLKLFHRKYFDLYFLHYLNLEHWVNHFLEKKIIDQVTGARDAGLIKYIGFSSHDTPENIKKIIDYDFFDAVILSYNILRREHEETIEYASDKGLGIIIMNPLSGGALADKDLQLITGNNRNNPASDSLNFVLSHPNVHCVLSGMESIGMIDENTKTVCGERFSVLERDALLKRIDKAKDELLIHCTECGYCLPCTQGMNIPEIIKLYNQYNILGIDQIYSRDYAILEIPAECCIQCETCRELCPQNIDIPEIMNSTKTLFK
jgi:predicted aldo/keto reductase-like oxidoreductase